MVEINRVWINVDTDTTKSYYSAAPVYPSVWMSTFGV